MHREPPINRVRDAGVEGPVSALEYVTNGPSLARGHPLEPSLLTVDVQPDFFLPIGDRDTPFGRSNDDGLARRGRHKFLRLIHLDRKDVRAGSWWTARWAQPPHTSSE